MIDIPTKIWTVYLLECGDKTLYCGITNDLENRLKQHAGELTGGAKYQEKVRSRSDALKRELIIKKMSRETKLSLVNSFKSL